MEPLIVLSGIEPGKKGAGHFIAALLEALDKAGVPLEVKITKTPSTAWIQNWVPASVYRFLKKTYYVFAQLLAKPPKAGSGRNYLVLHPQSLNLDYLRTLLPQNKLYVYVFDNFFFCIKSYNSVKGSGTPCFACLGQNWEASTAQGCKAFPVAHPFAKYVQFWQSVAQHLSSVVFLTQTTGQQRMLERQFGEKVQTFQIGMVTQELGSLSQKFAPGNPVPAIDFVFHNTLLEEKGIKQFLALAKEMPTYQFWVPNAIEELYRFTAKESIPANVVCRSCTWENGLADWVRTAKGVMCLSIWSYPIEGAMMKSILTSKKVIVYDIPYSYAASIPEHMVIKLNHTDNFKTQAQQIELSLQDNASPAQAWAQKETAAQAERLGLLGDFFKD